MMPSKFLKRAMDIVKYDIKDTASSYTMNLQALKKDAVAVGNMIKSDTSNISSTVQDTFKRIKAGKAIKDITTWFYNSAEEEDNKSESSDDFDNGMDFEGPEDDSNESNSSSKPQLSIPSSNETAKQLSAMYKIGAKQTEASVANTAEIVTNFNSRAADIIASIQSVDKNLVAMSEKIDKLVAIGTVIGEQNEKAAINNNSVVDENGNLTLTKIYETLKTTNKITNNMYFNMAKIGYSMIAGQSPEEAFSSAMGMLRDKIKVKGKSINEWGDEFNEFTGMLTQRILRGVIDNDAFKKVFGDTTATGSENTDYSQYRVNRYDEKQAVFDGMTRQSIINIIPGYLKSIDEHLRGRALNIDDYGNLTTDVQKKNQFANVTTHAFEGSALSSKYMDSLRDQLSSSGSKITKDDLEIAGKALLATYVMYLESSGRTTISPKDISPTDNNTINYAVNLIMNARGGDSAYWYNACQQILFTLSENWTEREKFIQSVAKSSVSMKQSAMQIAQSSKYGDQAGIIVDSMLYETFKNQYGTNNTETEEEENKEKPKSVAGQLEEAISNKFDQTVSPVMDRFIDTISRFVSATAAQINPKVVDSNGKFNMDNAFSEVSNAAQNAVDKVSNSKVGQKVSTFIENNTGDNNSSNTQTSTTSSQPTLDLSQSSESSSGTQTDENGEGSNTPTESQSNSQQATASNNGNKQRPDVINSVTGAVRSLTHIGSKAKTFVSEKAHDVTNKARDIVVDQFEGMKIQRDYENTVQEFSNINDKENITESDKIIVQTVMQMAQTATSDGEVTSQDIQAINNQINLITDANIKRKIKNSIVPMLNRVNTKSTTDANGDQNKKSGLVGKILMGVKLGFNVILKPIKTFIRLAFSKLKTFTKKLFSSVIKMFKSGAYDVKFGAANVKEALMGVDGQKGLVQQTGGVIKSAAGWVGGKAKKVGSWASDKVKGAAESIKEKISKSSDDPNSKLNKLLAGISNTKDKVVNKAIDVKDRVTDIAGSAKNKASEILNNAKEKFGNTEFGKGFMSVFNKEELEKKKAKLKTPENMTDVSTNETKEMIEGKKESLLTIIRDNIISIVEKMEEMKDDEEQQGESGEESSETSTETTNENNETSSEQSSNSSSSSGESSSNDSKPTSTSDIISGSSSSETSSEATTDANGGAGAEKGVKGTGKNGGGLFNIGKMLGGITKILGGLAKMALSIVMGMSGVKAILSLVENVLKTALKPLNKVFQSIYKAIKPIIKQIGSIINDIAKSVTKLAIDLLKALTPVLDVITPILDELWEALEPFLDMIIDSLDVVLKPIGFLMKTVVAPVLKGISATINIISGTVTLIVGAIKTGYGKIISAVGHIVNLISFGALGRSIIDAGQELQTQGATDIENGTGLLESGWASLTGKDESSKQNINDYNMEFTYGNNQVNGSVLDGTYGSGDQHSYGTFMNMGNRGCGPLALTESIRRRTGQSVDPYALTAYMGRSGDYDSTKGTSVAGFINAANSYGAPLTPGHVTVDSLSYASPRNPITVIGSGTGYDTSIGNNHYVNVIGKSGSSAIVSNPLTGKVSRQPINDLVTNSKLGLYGSGDIGFELPDSITAPLSRLAELTGQVLSLFTIDDGTTMLEADTKTNEDYEKAKTYLSGIDEEGNDKFAVYETKAREKFEEEHPKLSWESDEDYESRWQKNSKKYIVEATKEDLNKLIKKGVTNANEANKILIEQYGEPDENGNFSMYDADGNKISIFADEDALASETKGYLESILSEVQSMNSANKKSNGSFGASGVYGGDSENVKMYDFGKVKHPKTDITQPTSDESPVYDFFGYMSADKGNAYSSNEFENWYNKRKNPQSTGEGTVHTATGAHGGVDIQLSTGNDGRPLYAITDGKITDYRYSNSGGNMIRWKDANNFDHIYMHMQNLLPQLSAGQEIKGGDLVGYVGNTGESGGAHIHYGIYKNSGWSVEDTINPLTYWEYKEATKSTGAQGRIDMSGKLSDLSAWDSYKDKDGVKEFINYAFQAGMSPAAVATMMSTGIWEDSGKKIFGASKSLTDVTYDYNGQQAVGIMNWVDIDTSKYGSTVPEQLSYIQKAYFDPSPSHSRGYAVDPYRSDYNWGSAYETMIGKKPGMKNGDPIGPTLSKDLIEGSSYFYGGALVPACFTTPAGFKYVATAADAYNWMIDNNIINVNSATAEPSNLYKVSDSKTTSDYGNEIAAANVAAIKEAKKTTAEKGNDIVKKNKEKQKYQAMNTAELAHVLGSGELYGSGDLLTDSLGLSDYSSSKSTTTYHVYNSTDNLSRADMINALNEMEFKISAERLEYLTEEILKRLDNINLQSNRSVSQPTQSLFNNEIPSQVARLYT